MNNYQGYRYKICKDNGDIIKEGICNYTEREASICFGSEVKNLEVNNFIELERFIPNSKLSVIKILRKEDFLGLNKEAHKNVTEQQS
jgi:hypothetical protein